MPAGTLNSGQNGPPHQFASVLPVVFCLLPSLIHGFNWCFYLQLLYGIYLHASEESLFSDTTVPLESQPDF